MDIRVLRVRRESRDRWDALAIQGQPVRRGRGDSREFQARQDHGDRQELRARSAPKVRREFLGIRGQLAPWVLRVSQALPVRQVQPAQSARRGQPVRKVRKGLPALPVPRVRKASQVLLAPPVRRDHKDLLASPVRSVQSAQRVRQALRELLA